MTRRRTVQVTPLGYVAMVLDGRVPQRRHADYCRVCGMNPGRHWLGCPEKAS